VQAQGYTSIKVQEKQTQAGTDGTTPRTVPADTPYRTWHSQLNSATAAIYESKSLTGKDQDDRKSNFVFYGINECGKGTPRHERLKHEVDKVTEIVTKGENSISPLSIPDLFRLGKHRDQPSKPQTILTCTIDVSLLLSKARSLPKDIRIKPGMTSEEWLTDWVSPTQRKVPNLNTWNWAQSNQNSTQWNLFSKQTSWPSYHCS